VSATAAAEPYAKFTAAADPADHLRALYRQSPATLAGSAVGIALVVMGFWPLADNRRLWLWLALAIALWVLRALHYTRWRLRRDADTRTLLAWRTGWRALVLLQGGLWPLAVWWFWGLGSDFHQLLLVLVAYSYTLGSVQLLATQPTLFIAFVSLVLLPIVVRVASDSTQPWHWQLAIALSLLFAVALLMGRTYRDALSHAILLKQRTDQLAAQLKVEKAAADDARRIAEAASRAKTQFFAAASHDLRQPLHAMGLFAEALRQKSAKGGDAEVAALVNSINQSVDALEGLFGELLDLTRIDSGGVEAQPAPLRLHELFARLRLHFEPTAFEKGLALSFHGGHRVAHTDGLIVERILRNLVSNAIRYSDDGGILVACRPRGEEKLLLQVWDSGIGITPAALPHVFDEFYQVQGSRPLEPHQKKGLGLGLAIVKRLAGLIDAPIDVRSRVGRGTVFSFEVPAGREPQRLDRPSPAAAATLGLSLDGKRVVVVEDEPAVREGLAVLLQAWGAAVLAYDSLPALRAALAAGALGSDVPDLALVDYRLPEGTTGVQALDALRAHWPGATLPAVIITGSSLGGHEAEAAAHDFHLLIKPVLPNKLRSMIGFKLGSR
jgi:two-component system, sensor histidine kinase